MSPARHRSGDPRGDGGAPGLRAVLLVVVILVIGVVVLRHAPAATTSATTTPRTPAPTTAPTTAPATTTTTVVAPSSVKLQVLNGVLSGELATEWSKKLQANPGYDTLAPDNATGKVMASQIYIITPGFLAEGEALAKTLGLSATAVDPTIPAPTSAPIPSADRAKANLVLVIGPDLASQVGG